MKNLLFALTVLSLSASASIFKQFPEDDVVYRPRVDTGFGQYQAPSLHGSNQLVLTYDDGPHPTRTPKILDILKKYNVKATFFILTSKVNNRTKPIVRRIVEEGHIVASHDHDHDNNNNENEQTYRKELTETITWVEEFLDDQAVHRKEMYYRFPYGAYGKNRFYHHMNVMKEVSDKLYNDNCINFAFWDIDTSDWVPSMSSENVAANIRAEMEGGRAYTFRRRNGRWIKVPYTVSNPKGGGVVLMHDIQHKTIKATELILQEAKQKGWEIIPLNEVKEFSYGQKECIFRG